MLYRAKKKEQSKIFVEIKDFWFSCSGYNHDAFSSSCQLWLQFFSLTSTTMLLCFLLILLLLGVMINSNTNNNIYLQIDHNKRPDTVLELKIKEFGKGLQGN